MRVVTIHRIGLAVALILALFAAGFLIAAFRTLDHARAGTASAQEIVDAIQALRGHLITLAATPSADVQTHWQREIVLLREAVTRFEALHSDPTGRRHGEPKARYLRDDLEFVATLFARSGAPPNLSPADARELQRRRMGTLRAKTSSMFAEAHSVLRAEQVELERAALEAGLLAVALTVLLVLSYLGYLLHIQGRVLRPLALFRHATERVSAGDLSVRLGFPGKDEMADLARAFDRMSAALANAQEALAESVAERTRMKVRERMLQRIRLQARLIEAAHEAIVVREFDGRVLEWNRGAELLYGYSAQAALGQPIAQLLAPRPANDTDLRTLEGALLAEGNWRGELWQRCADGREVLVVCDQVLLDISSLPKEEEEEQLPGQRLVLEIHHDITERKQHADALRRTNELLSESNIALQRFAYVASHDLQTPLRSIAGFTDLLRSEYAGRLDARAEDWLSRISNSSNQLYTLIGDLLRYSQLETVSRPFEDVSMRAIVDQAVALLGAGVAEAGAEVSCGELPTVRGERSQLVQLMLNLIGNALLYRSAEPPRIRVTAERLEGIWTFSVRDNGIGIAAQYQEKIFEMFRRLHDRSSYPGTGIGLAVCRKVVERHGGRIWVQSEPGQGSDFRFTLNETREALA